MQKLVVNNILSNNILVITGYLAAALASFIALNQTTHHLFFWIPLGFAIVSILTKGVKVLPGIGIASLISHFTILAVSENHLDLSYSVLPAITYTIVELLTITAVFYIYNTKKSKLIIRISAYSLVKISLLSLFTGIILSLVQLTLIAAFSESAIIISKTIPLLLGNTLILFVSLCFSNNFSCNKKEDNKHTLLYQIIFSFGIILLASSFLLLPQFISHTDIYIIATILSLVIVFYAAIYLPFIGYSLFISVFTVGLVIAFNNLTLNIFSTITQTDLVASLLLITFFSQNLREKSNKFLKESNKQQVKEYSELNDKLLTEIEKLGLAQKEIQQQQKILTEAQFISGIATWEYSTRKKRFNWISHNSKKPLFDFDLQAQSVKSISEKIHPDDFKQLIKLKKFKDNKNTDFEFELRIVNQHRGFRYYWVKGRAIMEGSTLTRVLGMLMDITSRKVAEEVLLEREQRYQALFGSNIDPVCVIEASTNTIKDVNPAFEKLYEYSRDEIIGKSYLVLSDQPIETKSAIEVGRYKGKFRVLERVHLKKNGDKIFIEANLMKHVLDGKEMLFIITHDITRRKEAEKKIAEREQKFRTFFESDLIGMAEISFTKELTSFNNRLSSILGYNQNELIGKTIDELTHPDDLLAETKLFNQVITHKTDGYSLEKRFISKSSGPIYCKVSLKSIKSPKGGISHFIILVEDISIRKKAEEELSKSRAKLRHAQSVAKLGSIWFYNGNETITLSDEAYEMLGFENKRPTITRRDFFKNIIPSSNESIEKHICDLENGIPVLGDYEQTFVTPRGKVKYILSNFGLSKDSKGNVTEVLVTLADITKIKQAEMALQEANALKDQLFSIISHDLRSPISSISQLIDLYTEQKDEIDSDTSNSILNTLQNTSKETYKLLENLLEWASSQRTSSYKPHALNLAPVISQIVSLSQGAAEAKQISILNDYANEIPVFVDEEMLKTAIRNLLSNSIKFTPTSGTISITSAFNGSNVEISVTDSGVGIPESKIAKLFDNSTSFTTPGTNNEKGTGLGLKLVKKFIEKNGGSIRVESLEGQGTTFTISLPKYSES